MKPPPQAPARDKQRLAALRDESRRARAFAAEAKERADAARRTLDLLRERMPSGGRTEPSDVSP
jgi:hypothetical protein